MKLIFSLILLFALQTSQQNDFIFVNNNQKIVLKIDNGERNLKWRKTSILNLTLENIDPQKISLSAPGIMFKKAKNPNELNLEITPTKDEIENDTLNLNVGYKDQKDRYVSHKFSIYIK